MSRIITQQEIDKILELNSKGWSNLKISKEVGICNDTISKYLKLNGIVKKRPTKQIDQEIFEKLWSEGKTDQEIADHFKVSILTIKTFRTKGENAGKFNMIRNFSQTEQKLSLIQEQMILGSLLGDLSISKNTKNREVNAKLALVHCEKQKELFMKKVEILGDFMGSYKYCIPKSDPRTGKIYTGYRGNSKSHPVFTEIHNLMYKDGVKTVTQEYLDRITHPIALAYWFMDDGEYGGVLATNCFTLDEVLLLRNWLLKKWGITTSHNKATKGRHVIRILKASRPLFESLIYPYVVETMRYKLQSIVS